jgi:hypothetical protein
MMHLHGHWLLLATGDHQNVPFVLARMIMLSFYVFLYDFCDVSGGKLGNMCCLYRQISTCLKLNFPCPC